MWEARYIGNACPLLASSLVRTFSWLCGLFTDSQRGTAFLSLTYSGDITFRDHYGLYKSQ